jgi:hypothetical protein
MDFRNKIIPTRSQKATKESKTEYFKKRFTHKSIRELEAIIDNPSMVPDARKAAAELLETKS